MECKFSCLCTIAKCKILELIDTLWNVNTFRKAWFSIVNIELIDTLWNVN